MRRSAARKFAAARWPEGRLDASLSNSVVTTVGRPSPRASANFRPSALGKPRDTKPCLRRDTKSHFVAARTFLLRRLNSPVPKASDWLNEVSREAARVGVFVRRFRRFSCRGHLTQTEGRDDAATTGEGRLCRAVHVKDDGNHHATFKPRRRRVVLSGVSRASDAPRFVVRAGRRRVSGKHTYTAIYAQCTNAGNCRILA